MKDRFKMNRIGFVNFWLYDEEEFEFIDGKLLLRGQNASGKSITTQSFIPFILDGDRTPSRLDPFGSSDRRMEYYFLGEEGKDESTGYLFLEFKKESSKESLKDNLKDSSKESSKESLKDNLKDSSRNSSKDSSEEYRTIVIGQRAKKGKPMDFWGFVILDGRRIGHDLKLYKQIGSSKIPLDRREMKIELGEDNFFTTSQSEYKKAVNQYIFGFRKAEQYEQFIKLLVKVRAPKLSKEFKPTEVYKILNDSLQTLTDEDLRAMVDAMEKMDEIQESLEILKRAFDDVKSIRKEYTRYNQYMLAKKAQAYIAIKQKIEREQCELNIKERERQEAKETQNRKKQRLADLEEQKKLKGIERAGLLDADLEGIDRKLEQARGEMEEAARKVANWEKKIRDYQEALLQGEQNIKKMNENLEQIQQELGDAKSELREQQEILQWNQHEEALRMIDGGDYETSGGIVKSLDLLKKLLNECKREIREYEEVSRQYDGLAAQLEKLQTEKAEEEQKLESAQEEVIRSIDQWITDIYEAEKTSSQWKPDGGLLPKLEENVREYQSAADAETIQELLRTDYERQRERLMDLKRGLEYQMKIQKETLEQEKEKLICLKNSGELEPERDESIEHSRMALEKAGIKAVPFYKTVEFSNNLNEMECARLEAQLQSMGILDALVVSTDDLENIRKQCPDFLDTILYVKEKGSSDFSKLIVSEELEFSLKEMVQRILSNIYDDAEDKDIENKDRENKDREEIDKENRQGIYLGKDGTFKQGILIGKAGKTGSAEFVGVLARKRRKEQKIRELEGQIFEITEAIVNLEEEIIVVQEQIKILQEEYQKLPSFSEMNAALNQEKECEYKLQKICEECEEKEAQEQQLILKKNQQYQTMLQKCRPFPYARTEVAYEEAIDALEEYSRIWQEVRQALLQFRMTQGTLRVEEERASQNEQLMDDAFGEKHHCSIKEKESEIQIRQFEEYLNRPEIAQKAERLKQLKEELEAIGTECDGLKHDLGSLEEKLRKLLEDEPKQKESLREKIITETYLRNYFEEELALKLVFDRENQGIFECAKRAVSVLRESDKNRESTELLQALNQVYQHHNGSLVNYGTCLEDCFDTPMELSLETERISETMTNTVESVVENVVESAVEKKTASTIASEIASATRKRVRIVSSWNGKRVYLEEFYGILKQAIEETELLIQKRDRELFEDILSQTISRQLTDRIAESRKWVSDMSHLMKEMDTSMGLIFSLDWKPRKAENDMELDTAELEQILLRDHTLLTIEDIEKVAAHFRSKIRMEKMKLEENGNMVNYMELVRDALDYRRWFEFHMYFRRGEGERKLLTNAAFNRFSGGEKAMAMYVPLFAAVNAQYKKAEREDHPRMIALDEAFAGVDDKNISSMFELVHKLDFDYIMNSQALWGCFETVKGLRIAELSRPQDSKIVSVILYTWNGREKILDV